MEIEGIKALDGIRILDIAGREAAFCSRLLADMGASVTKIESPEGDPARYEGPFYGQMPHPEKSISFWYNNAGKRGITLNLETNKGQEILCLLSRKTDVIIESYSPGYLKGLGLDYVALSQANPSIIMASITGFGQSGPYRYYKSCNIAAAATGGQMSLNGTAGNTPLQLHGQQTYYTASLFAAIGILLALRERRASRRGQHIDISLQEATASTLEHAMVRYFYENIISRRQGNHHWNNAFFLLPCEEGKILLSPFMQWDILVNWLQSEGMAGNLCSEEWQSEDYRLNHLDYILDILKSWTKTHTSTELFETAQLMRLPWAPVVNLEDVCHNPQLEARGFFVALHHPETGATFSYPGAPYLFSRSPWHISGWAPRLGEHNIRFYSQELGFTQDKLDALHLQNVI